MNGFWVIMGRCRDIDDRKESMVLLGLSSALPGIATCAFL